MRVLFLAAVQGNSNIGGAATAIRNLGEALRRRGHQVDYLFAESFPRRISTGPWATLGMPWAAAWRLATLPPYDIVDVTSGDAVLFLALRRAGILKKHGAVIMRSHGSEHLFADVLRKANQDGLVPISPAFRLRFLGLRLREVAGAMRWADGIICCTNREAEGVAARLGIEPQKFCVVAHGVGDDFLSLNGEAGEKKEQVAYVGTWVWNKGTKLVVEVFRRLHSRNQSLRFLVAGSHGSEDKVRQDFPREMQGHLEVAPSLLPRALARRMAESQLLIFPSHYEGFGLVALEAMSVGTPVVMSRSVGLADWLPDEDLAALAPLDADALTEACSRLLADRSLREGLAGRARSWARTFTWDAAAERTAAAYARVLASRTEPGRSEPR